MGRAMNSPIGGSTLSGEWIGLNRDGIICEDKAGMARFRRPGIESDSLVTFQAGDGAERTIGLVQGIVVEVAARSGWSGLGAAVRVLRSGQAVEPWRLALFEQCGDLFVEPTPMAERSDEIVCACKGVTRGEIASFVERCPNRAQIGQACGAGAVCGGCGPLLDEIAGQGSMVDAELIGADALGGDVKRFRFRYFPDLPVADAPGAFVYVQCVIDNRRITRPYTITGTTPDGGVEIVVKREPAGVFSRWLHDHARPDCAFRLSLPQRTRRSETRRSLFFIAAGIGITPAITEMSVNGPDEVGVHWSVRGAASPFVAAVAAQAAAEGCALTVHDTSTAGRVADWIAVCPPGSAEGVVVCGPPAFQQTVVAALRDGGWSHERITVESFAPRHRAAATLAHVDSFDYLQDPVVAASFHLAPIGSVQVEAHAFLRQFYYEHGAPDAFELRWHEVAATTGS